ncbi:MAG TPA: sugar phosphate isomerase/epimerase family protein [Sphaerochaeta sp.]|nr:sugar phosphate isomerase/epimerase family protein [Sphaerochaeta sp.]
MKYGIYFAYWEQEWGVDFRPYIKKVKKLGFDVLEFSCASLVDATKQEVLEIRKMAEDEGIILSAGYGPSAEQNLASSNPAIIKNAISFYSDILQKLHILGITTIGGGIYSYWPVDFSLRIDKQADWARSITNVRTVAKIAESYGIDYCLEVLNRFEGYLLNTAEEARAFVEEVDVPSAKIMLDTFHMNIEENNMMDAIRIAGDKLGHFHVGENNRRVPGQGGLPWYELGCALHDIHYDNKIVMEPFVLPGGTIGSDIKVWRDINTGASQEQLDKDAANSVEFLRFVFENR